jgi:hypothetical protein
MSTPTKIYENWSNGLNDHMGSQQTDRQLLFAAHPSYAAYNQWAYEKVL